MDKTGKDAPPGGQPRKPDIPVRPGGSGEGSRSALEELIRQERRRVAQRPRDQSEGGPPPQRAP